MDYNDLNTIFEGNKNYLFSEGFSLLCQDDIPDLTADDGANESPIFKKIKSNPDYLENCE